MNSCTFYVMAILKVIPASSHELITILCLVTDTSFDSILLAVAISEMLKGASIVVLDFKIINSGRRADKVYIPGIN